MFHQFDDITITDGQFFTEPSMIIPNQAPTLQELVLSALQGEPLPLTSQPLYDDDENSGDVRLRSLETPIEDIVTDGRNGEFDNESAEEVPQEVPEQSEETPSGTDEPSE